ncbi:MAG: hypothetical protein PF569_01520 [Candidatus Woesearchaeota archaeon]|nr:hypothetical protein [Candidatus Woesearchaeota archaeon]
MKLLDKEVCWVIESPLGERFFLSRKELDIVDNILEIEEKDLMLVQSTDPKTQQPVSGLTRIMGSRSYNRMNMDSTGSIIGTVLKDSPMGKAVVSARSGIVV